MEWLAILLVIVGLIATTVMAALVIRHGSRTEYLNGFPFVRMLSYTLGIQLLVAFLEWLFSDPEPMGLKLRAIGGMVVFAFAALLWGFGFAFGSWRRDRRLKVDGGQIIRR